MLNLGICNVSGDSIDWHEKMKMLAPDIDQSDCYVVTWHEKLPENANVVASFRVRSKEPENFVVKRGNK